MCNDRMPEQRGQFYIGQQVKVQSETGVSATTGERATFVQQARILAFVAERQRDATVVDFAIVQNELVGKLDKVALPALREWQKCSLTDPKPAG